MYSLRSGRKHCYTVEPQQLKLLHDICVSIFCEFLFYHFTSVEAAVNTFNFHHYCTNKQTVFFLIKLPTAVCNFSTALFFTECILNEKLFQERKYLKKRTYFEKLNHFKRENILTEKVYIL